MRERSTSPLLRRCDIWAGGSRDGDLLVLAYARDDRLSGRC